MDGNTSIYYYTESESYDILINFLKFQLEDNYEEFLVTLFNVLNKTNGKKNALWIKGPPDCAKSWFFSSIECFMITVGKVSIMNRTNHFCLSSCTDCRLILLDELCFEPLHTDTLKLLFSGNPVKVSKKYADDVTINKTPCIIMSNGDCLPNIPVFNSRIEKYEWSQVPKDKNLLFNANMCSKKLHPFVFFKIWKELELY